MINKQKFWQFYSTKQGYTLFLISILIFFVLTSFLEMQRQEFRLVVNGLFLINCFWAIKTLDFPEPYLYLCRLIACLAFLADVITFPSVILDRLLISITYSAYIFFLILAILSISLRIAFEYKIDWTVIEGAICIYFLLGIIWFLCYSLIKIYDPQAFYVSQTLSKGYSLLHFSFTTLTTTGYGDIAPVNPLARILANLEGIIGQLYPAIVIARLVSLYNSPLDK